MAFLIAMFVATATIALVVTQSPRPIAVSGAGTLSSRVVTVEWRRGENDGFAASAAARTPVTVEWRRGENDGFAAGSMIEWRRGEDDSN